MEADGWLKVAEVKYIAIKGYCGIDKLAQIFGWKTSGDAQGWLRRRGGKIYPITSEEFANISKCFKDYQKDEVETVQKAIRSYQPGQGFASYRDAMAIELYAMGKAKKYMKKQGYRVKDVSATESYDLLCERYYEQKFVEVKGTRGQGDKIILTANEVKFVQNHKNQMILYILHSIKYDAKSHHVQDGIERIIDAWDIHDKKLMPIAYYYVLTN